MSELVRARARANTIRLAKPANTLHIPVLWTCCRPDIADQLSWLHELRLVVGPGGWKEPNQQPNKCLFTLVKECRGFATVALRT